MRILSAFALTILGISTNAQVTLTNSMFPIGTFTDRLYIITDTGTASIPTDGANQTWDLSSVTLQDIGTFTHGPAAATPYAATYPTANIAWHMDMGVLGSNYSYFATSATGMSLVATDVPDEPDVYSDPMQVLSFPLSLNGTFSDPWTDAEGSGTVSWVYGGHGTAITPVGTFANVVKLVNEDDEVVLWRTSPLVPLVLSMNGLLLAVGPPATGIVELGTEPLSIHPVPCMDRLTVEATAAAPWRIIDMQGRTVLEDRFEQTGAATLPTETLQPGSYVLHLAAPNAPRMARFVKQ